MRENNLLDDCDNFEFLPAEGLTKRFPTDFVSELRTFADASVDLTGATFVALERDDEDYVLGFYTDGGGTGRIAAWDSQGTPVEIQSDLVGDADQLDYVQDATNVDLRWQQVADALYLVDRRRAVVGSPGALEVEWFRNNPGAGLAILQGAYNTDYSVRIKTEGMANPFTYTYRSPSFTSHSKGHTVLELGSSTVPGSPNDIQFTSRGHYFFHSFLVAADTVAPALTFASAVRPASITDIRFYYQSGSTTSVGAAMITAVEIPRTDFTFDSFTGACAYTGQDPAALNADRWILEQVNDTQLQRGVAPNDIVRQLMIGLREHFDGSDPERPQIRTEGNQIGPLDDKTDGAWSPIQDTTSNAIRVYFQDNLNADDPIETWDVQDGEGGQFSAGWQKEVAALTDLPVFWKTGAVVKLTGDTLNKADDEYVEFIIEGGGYGEFGRGVWRETVARGLADGSFDLTTMPHLIKREEDGSGGYRFRLSYGQWNSRSVGDDDSAPEPSFVGERIFDICWHENRLGLVAGPHLVMSESGNAKNFWRTTLNAIKDSAPIDVTLTNLDGDTAFNCIPYDGSLMVFAEQAQTRISSDGPLSVSSIEAPVVSGFRCSGVVRPVVSGRSLFFSYTTGDYTQIRQLIPGQYRADFQDAQTTIAVDQLIPSSARKLIPNHTSDALVVLTDDKDQVFIHQYLQTSRESMMSAWGRWSFPGSNVEDVLMIGDRVYMPMVRNGKTYLETLLFGAGRGDQLNSFKPRLDRQAVPTSASYDRGTDSTTWVVPFDFDVDDTVALAASQSGLLDFGSPVTVTSSNPGASTITAPGNLTSQPMVAGVEYTASFAMSHPILKQPSYKGGMFQPVGNRQIVRDLTLNLTDTGYMRADVEVVAGESSDEEFIAWSDQTGLLDASSTRTGEFRIPILADVNEFRLVVSNSTALPSTVVSGAWTIRYNSKKASR